MGKLTDIQKLEIVKKYNLGYNGEQLGREYGIRGDSILEMLRCRGVKLKTKSEARRKYTLNENFFDIIDTEEKAYFLGLLYADGYNNELRGEIHLTLQLKDKHILERFREAIGSNRPLMFLNLSERNNGKTQDAFRFDISSRTISSRLKILGCPQAKSLILEFPDKTKLPEKMLRHFIRGYFDGDGCFVVCNVKNNYNQYALGIVSTENFCRQLQDIVMKYLQINSFLTKRYRNSQTTTRNFQIGGNLQVMKFLDWIYMDSTIYLNRKYQKYLKAKQEKLEKTVDKKKE